MLLCRFWVQQLVKTSWLHYPQCNLSDITRGILSDYMQFPLATQYFTYFFMHKTVNTPFKKHLRATYCSMSGLCLNVMSQTTNTRLFAIQNMYLCTIFFNIHLSINGMNYQQRWHFFINSISSNVWNLWSSNREITLAELNHCPQTHKSLIKTMFSVLCKHDLRPLNI